MGVAYDLYGSGRSVIRAGFGTFYYQISNNYAGQSMNGPLGSFTVSTTAGGNGGFYGYGIAGGVINTASPQNPGGSAPTTVPVPAGANQVGGSGIIADKLGDSRMPYANTYSLGIAQALPAHTVVEISYVGSMSRNVMVGSPFGYTDVNAIQRGAFFAPDPITGNYQNVNPIGDSNTRSVNDWRPFKNYQALYANQHVGYANYNSLQVSGQKQSGNLFLFSNFTFGKVLGTRDSGTANGNGDGNAIDPFSLANNYGPLAYDHSKVFNFSASYKLPSPIHHNAVLGEVVNGWQISTYTTYQDGGPFQGNIPAMNMNYHQHVCSSATDSWSGCNSTNVGATVNSDITQPYPANAVIYDSKGTAVGAKTQAINADTWYGSSEYPQMEPVLTCDPREHLAKGQYFNPSCFRAPLGPTATTFGEMGQYIWPYIRTPHYFGSDLALFKAFRVNDSQRFEVRVAATNWLNHANSYFGSGGNSDDTLNFNGLASGSQMITNSQETTTGTPAAKTGFRWIQFAGKYYF